MIPVVLFKYGSKKVITRVGQFDICIGSHFDPASAKNELIHQGKNVFFKVITVEKGSPCAKIDHRRDQIFLELSMWFRDGHVG
jgi:hypothetical protein